MADGGICGSRDQQGANFQHGGKNGKAAGGEMNEGFWETEHRRAGATLVSVLIMIL